MTINDETRWATLIVAAQTGDKAAYSQLLNELYPYVRNVIAPRISQKDAIDDIAQEILISLHNSINTYDGERAFKPWLHAIITYRTYDYFRKHYKNNTYTFEDLDFTATPENYVTSIAHIGEYKDIEKALDSLSAKQRKVFELAKIQGYSMKEIATEMDMSESAVKVSVHRTLGKLKEMIG